MDEAQHLGPDRIGDYAEGLLAPAQRSEADAHLAACEACRRDLAAAQAYFKDVASLPVHRAPDRFLTRVHGRIARQSPWRRMFAWLSSPRLMPVPLAALSVVFIAVYYGYVAREAEEAPRQVTYAQPAKEEPPETRSAPPVPTAAAPAPVEREEPRVTLAAPAKPGRMAGSDGAEAPAKKGASDMESLKERVLADAGHQGEQKVISSTRTGIAKLDRGTGGIAANSGGAAQPKEADREASAIGKAKVSETESEALASAEIPERASVPERRSARPLAKPVPAPAPVPPQPVVAYGQVDKDVRIRALDAEDEEMPASRSARESQAAAAPASPKAEAPAPASRPKAREDGPIHYSLTVKAGKADAESIRSALKSRGIQAYPPTRGTADLWTFSVPPGSRSDLEAYLKSLGDFRILAGPDPVAPGGAPLRLTARIVFQ